MTRDQEDAAMKLQHALAKCAQAGLQGGVYDRQFCVWPVGGDPHPRREFFEGVREIGGDVLIGHGMLLDGGAGN